MLASNFIMPLLVHFYMLLKPLPCAFSTAITMSSDRLTVYTVIMSILCTSSLRNAFFVVCPLAIGRFDDSFLERIPRLGAVS